MGMTQGATGWPVSLAHSMRKAHTEAKTAATASKLKKKTTPTASITMRTVQRIAQFSKSFKANPFSVLPSHTLAAKV